MTAQHQIGLFERRSSDAQGTALKGAHPISGQRASARPRRHLEKRPSQCERILALLREANGEWVPLPRILALGIAQFGARILELRRNGYVIENRREDHNSAVHSWYRLVGE